MSLIPCLPASNVQNIARQGIHINRIHAENINKSPQEIHYVKSHTALTFQGL
jgi:hypothetical protein